MFICVCIKRGQLPLLLLGDPVVKGQITYWPSVLLSRSLSLTQATLYTFYYIFTHLVASSVAVSLGGSWHGMCVDAPYGMAIQLTSGCQSIDSLKGRLVFQLMHWKLNAKLHNGIASASAHKFQADKEMLFKSWLGFTTLHICLEEQEKVKN